MNTIQIIEKSREGFIDVFLANGTKNIEEDIYSGQLLTPLQSYINNTFIEIAKAEIEVLHKSLIIMPDEKPNYTEEEMVAHNSALASQISHWEEVLKDLNK